MTAETVGAFARRHAVPLAAAAAAWTALVLPTLVDLVGDWAKYEDYSHGFLIPVISGAILFRARKELAALPARRSVGLGLGVLLVSLVLFLAGHRTNTNILERLGAWGSVVGGVAFLCGTAFLRAKAFPFLFLLVSLPPPYVLLGTFRLFLKGLATRLAADLLGAFGYAASPEGNVLVIGGEQLEVADACSGIRSLMAIVATALLLAYLFQTGVFKGLLLTLTAVPITIAVNVFRIFVVAAVLASFGIDLTRGFVHDAVGLAVFLVSLGLLYASWAFYEWLLGWRRPVGEAL